MATWPGQHLYAAHGYIAGPPIDYQIEAGLSIPFVPMTKSLR